MDTTAIDMTCFAISRKGSHSVPFRRKWSFL